MAGIQSRSSLEEYKEKLLRDFFARKPSELTVEAVEISRGAYGVVLKGTFGEQPVAVKKIHQLLWGNAVSKEEARCLIEGFAKEARMLTELSHAHVVKSFGAFFDSNSREPILVMELMATDLRAFLKQNRGTLRLGQQLSFVWQVASGVQYLHHLSPPLAHRDLNDKNVLLAFDRTTVKIGDLGQSKYRQEANEYFNSKAPGNVHFMPPEATSDKPHYTISVDVYSLGVLAIEIATQCEPSPSTHGIGFIPEVQRRAGDLAKMAASHPLKSLAMRCICKEYKERPVIDQLVSELMAVLFTGCEEVAVLKDNIAQVDQKHTAAMKEIMAVLKDNLAQLERKHSAAVKDVEEKNFGLMEKLNKLEADNDLLRKEQDEKLVKLNEEQKRIISALQEKVRLDPAEQNSLKTQAQLAHFSERDISQTHGDVKFQFVGQYAAHEEREDHFQFKAPVLVTLSDPSVTARDSLSEASMQFMQSISQEAVNTDVAESPDRTEQSKKESDRHTTHPDHCSSGTGQLEDSTPNNVSTTGDCPSKLTYPRDYLLSFRFLKECMDPPKELIRPDSSMLDMIKRSGGMDSARQSSNRIDMFAPSYSQMPGPSHADNKRGSKSGSSRGSRPGGGHGPKIIEISNRFEPVELQKAAWMRASEVTSSLGEEEKTTAVDRQQDLVLALEQRIGSTSNTNEDVISYIMKHHNDQERCTPSFVFALSCAIGNASVRGSADAAVYNQEVFTRRCLLLKPLVGCKEELQEEVIYGLQCSIHKKQHPTLALAQMFTVLYEKDVVEENVFLRWYEKGRDEEGRGMTLMSVSPFITWLNN